MIIKLPVNRITMPALMNLPEAGTSQRIKIAAAQNGLSVYEYVENMLEQTVPPKMNLTQRRRGLNSEAVEDLLRFQEEIKRAHPDVVFEDSVETLRQLREERTRQLEQS